jgi:hypothetical protein
LEEEDFMGLGDLEQSDQALLGLFLDGYKLLAAMGDLEDRSTAAGQTEHLISDGFQDAHGQASRSCREVVQAVLCHVPIMFQSIPRSDSNTQRIRYPTARL